MTNPLWTVGDVSGSPVLVDEDHVYPDHVNELRTARDNFGIYNVKDYGAKGDGITDDTAAIQSVIGALGLTGGTILFPAGNFICASSLTVAAAQRGVNFVGLGGRSSGATTETRLTYTGAGTSFISARNTSAFLIENMYVLYSNASFTGILIDARGGLGGSDAAYTRLDSVQLGGSGVANAASLLNLDKNILSSFTRVMFASAALHVQGKTAGSYSNAHTFKDCTFRSAGTASVMQGGGAWSFIGCHNENAIGKFFDTDTAIGGCEGTNFIGCWMGDATSCTEEQIRWYGNGLNIMGCFMGAKAGANDIVIAKNDSSGIHIVGNNLGYADAGIDFGATTGHTDVVIAGNYNGCTDKITGTIPDGALIQDGLVTGIGGIPDANAIFDLQSTTRAFMPPRMTEVQRDAIALPKEGMVILNIDTHVLNFHNGTNWGVV